MILKDCITEPAAVKTVSYFKVSVVIFTLASADVIKESFLQATNSITANRISMKRAFIGYQKYNKEKKGEKELKGLLDWPIFLQRNLQIRKFSLSLSFILLACSITKRSNTKFYIACFQQFSAAGFKCSAGCYHIIYQHDMFIANSFWFC